MTTRNEEQLAEELTFWDKRHQERRDEAMDEDGGLFVNSDAQWLFINKVSELIGGEDAHKRFSPNELIEMCKEMSDSHEELTNMKECKDAQESYELFNPSSIL